MADCVRGPRIGKNGYARVPGGRRGVSLYAHRVAWEEANGPIPEGYVVHHTCGTKACVNVAHMEIHTKSDHHKLHATRLSDEEREERKRERYRRWYYERGGKEWFRGRSRPTEAPSLSS